ncbi:MAG: hypothetical protein RIS21_936 [Planctomycetota bacterium]
MNSQLIARQEALSRHPVFARLTDLESVRRFMEIHVFAVWDFMSLLKALQREITCVEIPWRPSRYPDAMVRLVNEIVLGEESDLDASGRPTSHFALYLRAMREVGADTRRIESFLEDLDMRKVPEGARPFVEFTLATATRRPAVEVAAAFFFGRERLIPGMFESITSTLRREGVEAPTFLFYLDRHIQVDAEDHGPLAEKCLDALCGGDAAAKAEAEAFGLEALEARRRLWDAALAQMPTASSIYAG